MSIRPTRAVLALTSLALLASCTTTTTANAKLGSFEPEGFRHAILPYRVDYTDPAKQEILTSSWALDNFYRDERGHWKARRAPDAFEGVPLADRGGRAHQYRLHKRDLSLRTASSAEVWLSSIPLEAAAAQSSLFDLAQSHLRAVGAAGYASLGLGEPKHEPRYAVRVFDARDALVDGIKSFETTFEQSSLHGEDEGRFVRIVLIRPPFTWRIAGADHAVLLIAGYAGSPADFARGLPDFERFVNRIDLADGATPYRTGAFDPQAAAPQALGSDEATAQATPEAQAVLRAALDAHAADVLACTGTERVALVLDFADGQVRVGAREAAEGSAELACVQHVLQGLAVPPGAGRVIHVLSR